MPWLTYPESNLKPEFESGLSASYNGRERKGEADVYHTKTVKGYEWINKSRTSQNFRERQNSR